MIMYKESNCPVRKVLLSNVTLDWFGGAESILASPGAHCEELRLWGMGGRGGGWCLPGAWVMIT